MEIFIFLMDYPRLTMNKQFPQGILDHRDVPKPWLLVWQHQDVWVCENLIVKPQVGTYQAGYTDSYRKWPIYSWFTFENSDFP